ncbi:hypothetical protein MIND_01375000 [Mycena indigotica]|uniref:Uncharacterized protein n=1 Tax=Mycena indigotica TaxID=2126181 RepID=A0A8H6RYX6_9AGAR|nr:uncharacterized protein MIND_01375000 [Mycena indigotica]KAF7289140.1 hypothetical protein MIND_01375000 [Mycena indigotica]
MLFLLATVFAHLRSTKDECSDINDCRRLFDIIWSCLVTIFLCIWVSVHPNVPPPTPARPGKGARVWNRVKWSLLDGNRPLLHRFKLMVVALIAPELIIGLAGKQAIMAHAFAHEYDVSFTHGFFIVMGGFVDANGHPIVTKKQIMTGNVLREIKAVPESEIEDKSKGDAFSKGLAFCQGLWFIAQCVARRAQHLPLAELEVATLAFATINALTWALWLPKPLDVRTPFKLSVTSVPAGERRLFPYSRGGPTPFERFELIFTNLYALYEYDPLSNVAVPTFWCAAYEDFQIFSTVLSMGMAVCAQLLCGSLFGAIHCIAWATAFPSIAEMWLWRAAALVLVAAPLILIFYAGLEIQTTLISDAHWQVALIIVASTYSLARIILLVLPLSTLRSLPAAAFRDVDWSVYIPHL